VLQLPFRRLQFRPRSEEDLREIIGICRKYQHGEVYDLDGLILSSLYQLNQDSFLNVIFPHLQGVRDYRRKELKRLYRNARRKWPSLQYFNDNPYHRPYDRRGLICHGWSYLFERCCIHAGDVVFDLGAAPGDFAALAVLKGAGTVIAFEPSQDTALAHTAWANRNSIVVERLRVGVSSDGRGETSLDDYVARKGLERVDFIKIDIEGSEIEALKGAAGLLKSLRPRLAICIYHDPNHQLIVTRYLHSLNAGYRIWNSGSVLFAWPA
jgi:hypothetical protein